MAKLENRDQKALMGLGGALVLFLILQLDFFGPSPGAGAAASVQGIEAAEQELLLAQVQARQQPLRQAELEAASSRLEALEAGLLAADSAALASAEMQEIVEALAKAEGVTLNSTVFGRVQLEGDHYARVPLTARFNCAIEQFVNLMASIANRKEILSTRTIQIKQAKPEIKSIQVQMTVAGYLPASRTPELSKSKRRQGGRG